MLTDPSLYLCGNWSLCAPSARVLESPESESVSSAIRRLQELGALDQQGQMTPLGFHVAALPVDVR